MKTLRILLLEDSPIDAELTLSTLAEARIPFTVHRVETREEFIAAVEDDGFDLILADFALPSFDGISALEIARERRPELPFIFVSGTLGEELAIDMLKSGATDYVLKQRLARLAPAVERASRESIERRELQRAERDLRRTEQTLHMLIESVHDYAIIMLDPEGRVVSWNSGAKRILGYEDAEIIGREFSTFFTEEDVADGCPRRELELAAATGRAEEDRWHVGKGGKTFWASGVLTPMLDEEGHLVGYAKVMRDITDRRMAEVELLSAKESAEAANRAKDQFLAVLSHELRTPLTPVLATVHALEDQPDLNEESRFLIEIIHRNIELEARLIDDLLDLTRISKGKLQLNLETIDAHQLLRQVVYDCASDVRSKELDLVVELTARHYMVRADSARLQQVLWNLIKNAIKFTPERGIVSIRTRDDGRGHLLVEVRDTGIGIDMEVLPRIFEAFEQGERTITRRYGGLGLGLAISKAIIDMHGGNLSAVSDGKDHGATFLIELATDPSAEDIGCNGVGEIVDELPKKNIRILLVDDHEDTGKVMKLLLEREGYDIRMANNVASAIKAVEGEEFDLLISDIGLPDGTGIDLIHHIRQHRKIPGIALSGFGMEDDIRRSKEAGFIEHLTKPVSFQRLHGVIREIIS